MILAAVWTFALTNSAIADTPVFQPEGVAEKLIAENVSNRRLIDLATNSAPATNRIIRAAFIEWLLTNARTNVHHGGLRLRNAIITNWLDLRNVEVPCEVQLEFCRFKGGVNLSGAHFLHNLSFQGSRFDGTVEARNLRVDGSLLLSTRALWSGGPYDPSERAPTPPQLANCLRTNGVYEIWPLLPVEFDFDEHRQLLQWEFSDRSQPDAAQFTATLRGKKFLVRQIRGYRPQPGGSVKSSVELEWVPVYRSESFPVDEMRQLLSNRLDVAFLSTPQAVKELTSVRWPLVETSGTNSSPFVVWWQGNDPDQPPFMICQETVFAEEVHLDGAAIGGNLEGWDAEFRKSASFNGASIGGNVFLDQARFFGTVSFGYLRTGHDFSMASSFFASRGIVNAYGVEIGGTLNLEWVHFNGSANFGGAHVSKELVANYVRFPNPLHLVNFRGFELDGSVQLRGAEFAAPVTFILAKIKGNFEAQNSVFEDDLSFEELERVTEDSFTFNTDFGSMTVDGFAIFENTCFARSVSFRNGAYGNLYFDGVRWPDASFMRNCYTNEPFSTNLLRLEGISFRTIRDISTGPFFHSRLQLKESHANLLELLQNYTPYSHDIYDKLEAYFRGEGERDLADHVFISGKIREGAEGGRGGRFINKFLRYTVMYGKWPWLAFVESMVVILFLGVLCRVCMIRKDTRVPPSLPMSLLYSLGNCLPLVDLKTADLLEIAPHKDWFRYLLAFAKVLGYILVPLWAVAWAGLVR